MDTQDSAGCRVQVLGSVLWHVACPALWLLPSCSPARARPVQCRPRGPAEPWLGLGRRWTMTSGLLEGRVLGRQSPHPLPLGLAPD